MAMNDSKGLHLTLLGGFDARLDGVALGFRRKKARALLAYLALEAGRWHPRDKLAALLWDDVSEERARHSLRQGLLELRRTLAAATPRPLVEEADSLTLVADLVDVDVVAFDRLVADGGPPALADAVELYRGDLLEG